MTIIGLCLPRLWQRHNFHCLHNLMKSREKAKKCKQYISLETFFFSPFSLVFENLYFTISLKNRHYIILFFGFKKKMNKTYTLTNSHRDNKINEIISGPNFTQ